MCRLLFLWGPDNKKTLIETFLDQSIHSPSRKKYLDGFGLAWRSPAKKWGLYKNEQSYIQMSENPLLQKTVSHAAKKKVVVGHLRKKNIGKQSLLNTQPFLYDNQIFCHNGRVDQFQKIKKKIRERINSRFYPSIQGETDSEYLFYLFLTCKQETRGLRTAMEQMISFLETFRVLMYLNVIYCNDEYSIITRYVIHPKTAQQTAPTLFSQKHKGTLILSSDPLLPGSQPVPENSILVIPLS